MAFSVAVAAGLANAGSAQFNGKPNTGAPLVTVQPWPSKPKQPGSAATPFMPPPVTPQNLPANLLSPAGAASRSAGNLPMPPSPRTVHYKKELNGAVRPIQAKVMPKSGGTIVPVLEQQPLPGGPVPPVSPANPTIQPSESLIPSNDVLFRLESESKFQARENDRRRVENERRRKVRDDARVLENEKRELSIVDLPMHKPLVEVAYSGRVMSPMEVLIEPNFVCYRRLLFEDKNTERYGWTIGLLQPYLSAWKFFSGWQALPYKYFSYPGLRYDSSAGLCLPGDPVPQLIYPPGLSIAGLLGQAAVTVAMHAIIP